MINKYYVGYFNKPWDRSEFTVICGCPSIHAARYILQQYNDNGLNCMKDSYEMLTAADVMDLDLRV